MVAQRGGLTFSVRCGLFARVTVGMPHASISRATSPPDWWQIGQMGTTTATSTRSDAIAAAMAGATCSARSAAGGQ